MGKNQWGCYFLDSGLHSQEEMQSWWFFAPQVLPSITKESFGWHVLSQQKGFNGNQLQSVPGGCQVNWPSCVVWVCEPDYPGAPQNTPTPFSLKCSGFVHASPLLHRFPAVRLQNKILQHGERIPLLFTLDTDNPKAFIDPLLFLQSSW